MKTKTLVQHAKEEEEEEGGGMVSDNVVQQIQKKKKRSAEVKQYGTDSTDNTEFREQYSR